MHEIKVNVAKNRLYVKLSGFSTQEQVKQAVQSVEQALKQLKPGFDLVSDISTYKPASPETAQELQRMQVVLKQAGLNRVIRVVNENVLTDMQFSRTAKTAGYAVDKVKTVAEADALLDGK